MQEGYGQPSRGGSIGRSRPDLALNGSHQDESPQVYDPVKSRLLKELLSNNSGLSPKIIKDRLFRRFGTSRLDSGMIQRIISSADLVEALSQGDDPDFPILNATQMCRELRKQFRHLPDLDEIKTNRTPASFSVILDLARGVVKSLMYDDQELALWSAQKIIHLIEENNG